MDANERVSRHFERCGRPGLRTYRRAYPAANDLSGISRNFFPLRCSLSDYRVNLTRAETGFKISPSTPSRKWRRKALTASGSSVPPHCNACWPARKLWDSLWL